MADQTIPVITVDGPGGTGKGTVSQLLAKQLDWHLLDSGSLYRILAHAAQQHAILLNDEVMLGTLAQRLDIKFVIDNTEKIAKIIVDGIDVTQAIRTEQCGNIASKISVFPAVRLALLDRQRAFRQLPGLVADGRDMGTVVFPDAQLKIFLEASAQERAKRRYLQLQQQGVHVSVNDVFADIVERDMRDKNRIASPLKPAADAILIDTTHLSIDSVVQRIMAEVNRLKLI